MLSGARFADEIASAINFMRRQSFIKPDGTVVIGHSAGGWGALALADESDVSAIIVLGYWFVLQLFNGVLSLGANTLGGGVALETAGGGGVGLVRIVTGDAGHVAFLETLALPQIPHLVRRIVFGIVGLDVVMGRVERFTRAVRERPAARPGVGVALGTHVH